MPNIEPKVVIRMGTHAEKDYVEKTIRFFDGIILGANLVEATPGATTSLLLKLCVKKSTVPYYIDPMTYAFGAYVDDTGKTRTDLDWIKSDQKRGGKIVRDFKKSYSGLAKVLGHQFSQSLVRKSAVSPSDFGDTAQTESCCKAIADYQHNRILDEFTTDPDLKSIAIEKIPPPAVVFAPYFYIEPTNADKWLDLVLRLASVTRSVESRVPVHAIVCVDESFLEDTDFLNRINTELPQTGVQGVWLWFSRFVEDQAATVKLKSLRSLVEKLSSKMQVFNMHGGYLSLALCKFGMSGISHGVGYGEQKDVVPVIGQSTPTVRYYLPETHKRFGVPQIQRCFNALGIHTPDDFHEKVCDCVICRGVVSESVTQFSSFGEMHYSRAESKRMAQTPAAAKRCRFHFLLRRVRERDWMKGADVPRVIKQFDAAKAKWGPQPSLQGELDFLDRWKSVLQ